MRWRRFCGVPSPSTPAPGWTHERQCSPDRRARSHSAEQRNVFPRRAPTSPARVINWPLDRRTHALRSARRPPLVAGSSLRASSLRSAHGGDALHCSRAAPRCWPCGRCGSGHPNAQLTPAGAGVERKKMSAVAGASARAPAPNRRARSSGGRPAVVRRFSVRPSTAYSARFRPAVRRSIHRRVRLASPVTASDMRLC